MKIEFDWQVGTQDGQLETLAHTHRPPRRRWPWWVWVLVASVLVVVAVSGYVIIGRRYEEAERRIAFQIQSVVDLEALAYVRQDQGLFLEQQDVESEDWVDRQAARLDQVCLPSSAAGTAHAPSSSNGSSLDGCLPVLPAEVDRIDLQGDIAWVEVIEDEPPVRRVRFYRQTERGWKHTAPRSVFWDGAIQLVWGDLIVYYHDRDQPHVDPMIEQIGDAFNHVCRTFGCSIEEPLEFDFSTDVPAGTSPQFRDGTFLLSSPWLSGIPLDGTPNQVYIDKLTYAVTYEMISRYLRTLDNDGLSDFEAVIGHEYAAWRSARDTAQAPIIGRLVELYGEDALPTVLRSLQQVRTLNVLMVQWMRLSATEEPVGYFETLLNIEREALVAGRKQTFLLLQDDLAHDWLAVRQAQFERAQMTDPQLAPVRVQTVVVAGDLARVTLENPSALSPDQGLGLEDQPVYFRRLGGDWKHTPAEPTQTMHLQEALPPVGRSEATPTPEAVP